MKKKTSSKLPKKVSVKYASFSLPIRRIPWWVRTQWFLTDKLVALWAVITKPFGKK